MGKAMGKSAKMMARKKIFKQPPKQLSKQLASESLASPERKGGWLVNKTLKSLQREVNSNSSFIKIDQIELDFWHYIYFSI